MKHLNLLLLLVISVIFCSCTITKRHFGNGYHVEWNHKMKAADSEVETAKMEWTESDFVLEKTAKSTDSLNSIDLISESKPKISCDSIRPHTEASTNSQIKSAGGSKEDAPIKIQQKAVDDEPEMVEPVKPHMHPLTWAIWGAWSIGIVFIFFVTFYAEALIGVAVFFLLAMIFAFFMIHSLRKHPEKYRLKKLSYGFVIPAIIFGGIVLAGLGLVLLMTLA